jgi:hypothetical protein
LAWLALVAVGTLLVMPATRYLLKTQMQMQGMTYSTETNLPAEHLIAARMPDDYPVQLALIVGLSLFQRVSVSTGLGRGLRGVAVPVAAALFLIYAISLLPTAHLESTVKSDMARVTHDETHYLAELSGKTCPGDPCP